MRRSARTVLCGGRSAMIVPTALLTSVRQNIDSRPRKFPLDGSKGWFIPATALHLLSHPSCCISRLRSSKHKVA